MQKLPGCQDSYTEFFGTGKVSLVEADDELRIGFNGQLQQEIASSASGNAGRHR